MIILLSQDLMLISKMDGIARQLDRECLSTGNLEDLAAKFDACGLIVIDLCLHGLDIEDTVNQIRSKFGSKVPIIAFGPHVHKVRLEQARAVECDVVATRGEWDRDALSICRELLAKSNVS